MNILQQIKSGIDKCLKKASNAMNYDKRKSIAFFVENAQQSKAYKADLIPTHEEDEIKGQMLAARSSIEFKAKLFMYEESLEGKKLKFDFYTKEQQDKLFISSVIYYRQYTDFFIMNDLKDWFDTYMSVYGKIEQLSELYLKATIKNDIELMNVLEKYL